VMAVTGDWVSILFSMIFLPMAKLQPQGLLLSTAPRALAPERRTYLTQSG